MANNQTPETEAAEPKWNVLGLVEMALQWGRESHGFDTLQVGSQAGKPIVGVIFDCMCNRPATLKIAVDDAERLGGLLIAAAQHARSLPITEPARQAHPAPTVQGVFHA